MGQVDRKKYGAKPFWAWNGDLKKEELIRQIRIMKEMGFGGFFMHSRTGLETPYLEDEWFDLINACADEAKRLDMEAWLYDEDRWPSGSAGGKATTEDRYRMKYLRMNRELKEVFEWRDDIISAFLTDADGIRYTKALPISRHTDLEALDLKTVVYFTAETMAKDPVYNGQTYLDTLSREATMHFIETTHERYVKKCGDRIGDSIPGIFTDEPYRGALMSGFSVPNRDGGELCPYTDLLFDDFEKAFGYRLEEHLPELFLRKDGNPYSPVKWQYTELLTRLFIDNFAKPYHEWCAAHHMKVTGHILHENSLTCQVSTMGSVMRYYEHMDIPGVDYLGEYGREYCVVKQLASACRQTGQKELLCELNGCTGWQMTFDRYKHIGDWQAIMGITLRCPHLSWYTMKGEAKRDYPASILHQSAWYEAYDALEDYYTRISAIVSKSERKCHVAVIMPVESVWAQVHASWASFMSPLSEEARKLDGIFAETYRNLLAAHVDFDYADEAMMAEKGAAESGTLRIGEAVYDTVIVSGMATMRRSTLELIRRVKEGGGRVIFAGDAPALVDVLPSDEAKRLAETCERMTVADLAALHDAVTVSDSRVILQTYHDDERNYYFLLNTLTDDCLKDVTVRFGETLPLFRYDPRTGETVRLCDGTDTFTTNLGPGELIVLIDFPLSLEPVGSVAKTVKRATVYADDDFTLTAGEPNLFVMNTVSYTIDGGEAQGPFEVLDADKKLRASLGLPARGGSMLQPWFIKGDNDAVRADVTLTYRFRSTFTPDKPLWLMTEDADSLTALTVNGTDVLNKRADGVFIDICFTRFDIASCIREGDNAITLRFGYRPSSGAEAVYLVGDFLADTESIRKTSGHAVFGSLTEQGYPFYGGKLTYRLTFDRIPLEGQRAILHLDGGENVACYEVEGVRVPFEPYEADITDALRRDGSCSVTLYLTRRNSFGPFFAKDKNPAFVGPESFHVHETDTPVLLNSGLIRKPYAEIIENKEDKD